MNRNRLPLRMILLAAIAAAIALAIGCAADPSMHRAARPEAASSVAKPEPFVFASIDDAALAGLESARASSSWRARRSIQVGTIRRAGGGYVFMPPVVADAMVADMRAPVLRLALSPEDVATYLLHPASGSNEIDARNADLNASEARLLGRSGRSRPLYLLTPRLDVVRHAIDEPALHLGDLRAPRPESGEAPRTAFVD